MGLLENVIDITKKGVDTAREKVQKQSQCEKDLSLIINILFASRELGIGTNATIRQKTNGDTYFNFDDENKFQIVDYIWDGPVLENLLTSNTKGTTDSETTKKGKAGKMATGAIIGTMFGGPIGTVVGAAIGAGGKSKSNTKGINEASTQQISKQVEKNSTAILKLYRVSDGAIYSITITCNSNINSKIQCFKIMKSQSIREVSTETSDALKGVKALKELLDMGAITEEEFELKKKQLLNL